VKRTVIHKTIVGGSMSTEVRRFVREKTIHGPPPPPQKKKKKKKKKKRGVIA